MPTERTRKPFLDVALRQDWRFVDAERHLVSDSGSMIPLLQDLPRGTQVVNKVPSLAASDAASLSADERNLARLIQVIFRSKSDKMRGREKLLECAAVESVSEPTEISLP